MAGTRSSCSNRWIPSFWLKAVGSSLHQWSCNNHSYQGDCTLNQEGGIGAKTCNNRRTDGGKYNGSKSESTNGKTRDKTFFVGEPFYTSSNGGSVDFSSCLTHACIALLANSVRVFLSIFTVACCYFRNFIINSLSTFINLSLPFHR